VKEELVVKNLNPLILEIHIFVTNVLTAAAAAAPHIDCLSVK
jgi:hypothetical protein